MSQDRINKYARIFFNALFLAFTASGLYRSFCDAYKYKGDFGKVFFASMVFALVVCVLWLGNSIWHNIGKLAVNLIFVAVIIRNYARIEDECGILYAYIKKQYYAYEGLGEVAVDRIRTSTSFLGIHIYEKLAMILVIFLIIIIMAFAVLRIRWYLLLLFPVVSVIGMEMLHGRAPSVASSFFLVVGVSGLLFSIKFESCGGRKNFWQDRHIPGNMALRYLLFTGIIIVCFIISLPAGRATNKKIFANSKAALERQHKIEREVTELVKEVGSRISNGEDGYLDNKSPDRTGRSVMRIETDRKPANNIYIKSFSKDIYENGRWKSFKDAKPPVPETDIDMETYNSIKTCITAKQKVAESLDWTDGLDNFNMDIIPDWKLVGRSSFTPYMYSKNKEGYQYNCYNMQNWMMQNILSADYNAMEFYGIKDQEEYTKFVYNQYLEVPEGLPRLRDFSEIFFGGDPVWGGIVDIDIGGLCVSVKNKICEDTKYSQNLDDVPDGQDYIEYFLFGQKKGYCEHYATAGTVLLRLNKVPARYVSGYFIRPSEFNVEYDKDGNEKYVANVTDYNAHAWTEVYKKGFGWLPFDMTNTVLADEYTENEDNQTENIDYAQEDFGQDTDEDGEDKEDTSSEKNIEQEEDLQEDKEDINGKSDDAVKNGSSSNLVKSILKIDRKFLIAAIVLLIILAPVIYIRIRFKRIIRKISSEDKVNTRVVLYFNLLNNYLEFCGLRGISKLDDNGYAGKISGISGRKASERACAVLQCAAFSNNDINKEDEKEVLLFVQNTSEMAYRKCGRLSRLIIYILTGRKNINIFTKVYN